MPKLAACPFCKANQEEDANFCDQCGELLRASSERTPPIQNQEMPELAERSPIALYASAVIVAAFVGLLIFQYAHRTSRHPPQIRNAKWEVAMRLVHDLQSPDRQVAQRAADELASSMFKRAPNSHVRQYVNAFIKDLVSDDPGTRRAAKPRALK